MCEKLAACFVSKIKRGHAINILVDNGTKHKPYMDILTVKITAIFKSNLPISALLCYNERKTPKSVGITMEKQIKSKKRVADHGEVFTAEREVNAMLDLVKQETERIDSRFLEPACGSGNFLVEVLRRKLKEVRRKYRKSTFDYEKNAVLAISSIYGVDLLLDNVLDCRERLFEIWDKEYRAVCKKETSDLTREAVRFILKKNIVCGNALTLRCVDEEGHDTCDPIVFSEWSFITGTMMQRKDYTFEELLNWDEQQHSPVSEEQMAFSMIERQEPDPEGRLMSQYITDYRRVQVNG